MKNLEIQKKSKIPQLLTPQLTQDLNTLRELDSYENNETKLDCKKSFEAICEETVQKIVALLQAGITDINKNNKNRVL